ncbi:hypothetical protein AB0B50_43560 [Streptomyces sp. NPDC041068]|uniref:hypothetical protein n=1 Tax=Streptomyces sp. NPDC041068 TaxID=3155130 RepID=UPI0033E091BC
MTHDAITSDPEPTRAPVLAVCGCWTSAPIVIGSVQSMSGGAGYTRYVCPDHVHEYPQYAQWDELPAMRRTPRA